MKRFFIIAGAAAAAPLAVCFMAWNLDLGSAPTLARIGMLVGAIAFGRLAYLATKEPA